MIIGPFLKSQPPGYRHDIRSCEGLFWIFLAKGSLHARWGGKAVTLGPRTCLVLPRGAQVELFTTRREGYEGLSITAFPPDDALWPGTTPEAVRVPAALLGLIDTATERVRNPDGRPATFLRSLAEVLVQETAWGSKRRPVFGTPEEQLLAVVEARLRSRLHERTPLHALLGDCGVTLRHLHRLFVRRHGVSPKEWQTARRLEEACAWLERPGARSVDFATEIGFSSPQHLATAFRRRYGRSPREWRRAPGAG